MNNVSTRPIARPGDRPIESQFNSTELTRRQFIQTGFLGASTLTLISSTAVLSGCAAQPKQISADVIDQPGLAFLRPDDEALYTAIMPAVIGPVFPSEEGERKRVTRITLKRIDTLMLRMGAHNQQELRKLFDLLNMRLTRFMTTGIWRSWENVSPEQADEFLRGWENSSFSLFRSAYNALCDTILFPYYTNSELTGFTGYSGPPRHVLDGLPQFRVKGGA